MILLILHGSHIFIDVYEYLVTRGLHHSRDRYIVGEMRSDIGRHSFTVPLAPPAPLSVLPVLVSLRKSELVGLRSEYKWWRGTTVGEKVKTGLSRTNKNKE